MSNGEKRKIRSKKTLKEINDQSLRDVPVDKYYDSGAVPACRDVTEVEKKRAKVNEEILKNSLIAERAKLAGLRVTGYEIIEKGMNYLNSFRMEDMEEIIGSVAAKNAASFLKSVSDIIKNLPNATTIKSIEIKETLEGLGDEELEKRIVEIEASLRQKGVL